MTQEEKDLLLIDLCARLPHHVRCKVWLKDSTTEEGPLDLQHNYGDVLRDAFYYHKIKDIKPYLRPMSSMTEEEKEELKSKCVHTETEEDWEGVRCDVWGIQIFDKYDTRRWDNPIWPSTITMDAIDWLNAHHFDYRGLIEKGLALEAPKEIYN